MIFDQVSLMTAIAFSAAALMVTMFVGWLGSRRDAFLLSWAIALSVIVLGVICFTASGYNYDPRLQFAAFGLTLAGFGFTYSGARQFRGKAVPLALPLLIGVVCNVVVGAAYIAGYSGIGAIIANAAMGLLLLASGREYWQGRSEAPVPMIANALLYLMIAISFVLCSAVLAVNQQWILWDRPTNWAEDLNSISVIIGLTGIGAISLTLNQFRSAKHHQRRAMTDSLTGLLNRRALFETFSGAPLEPGMAVIMLDIDHFKSINDVHGHAAGDKVLANFGAVMLSTLLRNEDVAARLGGEEFCVVVRNLNRRSAAAVAEQIRASFEQTSVPTSLGHAETTVSAGVAIAGIDGEPFEEVLRRADDALYKAKSAGRNRVHAPAPRLVA